MVESSPSLTDERKKLFTDFVAELRKREISSSENFDKSILTFSSAGLALSVGFLKDFIPIQHASVAWALYGSWSLFTLATCLTMASFLLSMRAMSWDQQRAYRYYIECQDSACDEKNPINRLTLAVNYVSGASFLTAMLLTFLFISINLEKASTMKSTSIQTGLPSGMLNKGLPTPTLQQVPPAPVPAPVPSPAPAAPTPASSKGP